MPDTAAALIDLARGPGRRSTPTVVGITGSVGKTSTKDLVAAAVGASRRVAANERSFNNDQGLPVTILGAPDDTEVLVLEMGMRGSGEIARLCDVGRPDVGVVTAVAAAHTARVGGIDGVARAKAELVEALPADGHGGPQRRRRAWWRRWPARPPAGSSRSGRAPTADVRIDELAPRRPRPGARSRRARRGATSPVQLAVSGAHMASNAAAALAVAGVVGVDLGAGGGRRSAGRAVGDADAGGAGRCRWRS